MKGAVVPLLAVACAACSPGPGPADAGCDARCLELEEQARRLHSTDLLFTSPRIWRFFDDYADQLATPVRPECARSPGDGGVRLLWRRTLPAPGSVNQFNTNDIYGSRNALSVAAGRIAVSLSDVLWILDAKSGVPQHGFMVGAWDAGNGFWEGVGLGRSQFAALTLDGTKVWVRADDVPTLVVLGELNEVQAPAVMFSWYRDVQRPQGKPIRTDTWAWATPMVDSDGTLYWNGASGWKRAIEASGRIRWEVNAPGGGRGFLAGGRLFWTMGVPTALAPLNGELAWQASSPADAGAEAWYGFPVEVERMTPRSFAPVSWLSPTSGQLLATHRLTDAGVAWSRRLPPGSAATGQATDGTVYLTRSGQPEPNGAESRLGVVEALDELTGMPRWTLDLPLHGIDAGGEETSHASIGPIPAERKDGVYVVTDNCTVYDIDGSGSIRGWYQMAAPPLGHTPQLVDGVLYVLAHARDLWPIQCPEDLSADPVAEYDCVFPRTLGCGPCIGRELFYLYAFQVE